MLIIEDALVLSLFAFTEILIKPSMQFSSLWIQTFNNYTKTHVIIAR